MIAFTDDDVATVKEASSRLCGGKVQTELCKRLNDLASRMQQSFDAAESDGGD